MNQKIWAAVSISLFCVFSSLGISNSAFAAVQGSATWSNFASGPNTSPVVITVQWPSSTTQELDLVFSGVRFNPSNFVSSSSNQISNASCTLGSLGPVSVSSSGTALTGTCSAQNPSVNNPYAQLEIIDPLIAGNTITVTFPIGSLEVTNASNATLQLDAFDAGSQPSSQVINLSALAPTPSPTPTPTPTPTPASLPQTGSRVSVEWALPALLSLAAGLTLIFYRKRDVKDGVVQESSSTRS